MKLDKLESEVLNLALKNRADLARKLLESLENLSEKEIEELWLDEVDRRAEEMESGKVIGRRAEEVLADAKARLAKS